MFSIGISSVLAVSGSAVNALEAGLLTAAVLVLSVIPAVIIKKYCPAVLQKPLSIIALAAVIAALEWGLGSLYPSIGSALGIYLPLAAANFLVLGMSGLYSPGGTEPDTVKNAAIAGIAAVIVSALTGFAREFLGSGGIAFLNAGAANIIPPSAVFLAPAGGFIITGLFLALLQHFGAGDKSGQDRG